MSGAGPAGPSRAKRVELSAAYLNAIAGALFTAGCIAPVAATVFGLASAGVGPLTVGLGVTTFFIVSAGVHLVARRVLGGLDQ